MAPTPLPPALQTAYAVLDGYKAWTIPSILAPRAPTCTHHILPASLSMPAMDNATYATYLGPILAQFANFTLSVRLVVHDEGARRVAMHLASTADTRLGPYANEYVLLMHMARDGSQVVKVEEFVDSRYSVGFLARLGALGPGGGGGGGEGGSGEGGGDGEGETGGEKIEGRDGSVSGGGKRGGKSLL